MSDSNKLGSRSKANKVETDSSEAEELSNYKSRGQISNANSKLNLPSANAYNNHDSDYIEPPFDENRILLDGINDSCSDEMIKLYLLLIVNETLDERIKIEQMRRNHARVLVKFNREINFDAVRTKQQKLPELCGDVIRLDRVRVPNTIKVAELPNNVTEEILKLYFTNPKVSDGGDIELIRLFNYDNKALISFKNYNIIDQLINRAHIICETQVKLEKFYAQIESDSFFDDDEELEEPIKPDTKLNKKDAKLKDLKSKKSLEQYRSISSSMTSLASNAPVIDKTKFIISNIQENINIQQLEYFIQLLSNKIEIKQVSWSFEYKGKLLVEFKREIDLKKVLQEYHKNVYNNLNGKPVQIEPVNLTRALLIIIKEDPAAISASKLALNKHESINTSKIENEDEIAKIPATRDLLSLYFVNKQRSGGGDIEFIERRSQNCWLVKMRDQRVIKELLSRKHSVDFKEIKVFPYYENFGLPYLIHFNFNFDSQTLQLPYKLKIKDERLRYFVKVKNLHQKLNDILSESNAISKYNKQESNVLYVHYFQKLTTKVPYIEKMWRIRVKESIEYYLQIYKYEKLTLSYNQWSTILKTKQINEALLYKQDDDDLEDGRLVDNEGESNRGKFFGELTVINVKDTTSNIEVSVVGPTPEVDKFIVRVKDIICKAYFTYELEERIIHFKTYLLDCETLLAKWLQEREYNSDDESDVEIVLASPRNAETSSLSASYSSNRRRLEDAKNVNLDKNKRKIIDDFISKLEKDHLDMELSYGKLFQELGYAFVQRVNALKSDEEDEDAEYAEFNDKTTQVDDRYLGNDQLDAISEMDRIKNTLDELKGRITEMRKKFRQYLSTHRPTKQATSQQNPNQSKPQKPPRNNATNPSTSKPNATHTNDEDEQDEQEEPTEHTELIKLCVFVKDQMKIITLTIHRRCKIRELKQILSKQIDDREIITPDRQKLTFNGVELINEGYTISDYGITNKCTISCEIDDDN